MYIIEILSMVYIILYYTVQKPSGVSDIKNSF